MKVALIHNARLPVRGYGGTERVVWWLARGLTQEGVEVILFASPGTTCDFAEVIESDFNGRWWEELPDAEMWHFFNTPPELPASPYVVTIEGNGKPGETFAPNTIFVSRNHAQRHQAEAFVYNGADPDELQFSAEKDRYLCFLAKASWKVKNLEGSIRIARAVKRELKVMGGARRFLFRRWRGVSYEGNVDGKKKSHLLARAAGLLFPVLWDEPFGIAMVEALMSGCPVFGTKRGSLPEIIAPEVGAVCDTEAEIIEAVKNISHYSPAVCRDWAASKFHYRQMTRDYLQKYEMVWAGKKLNTGTPQTR